MTVSSLTPPLHVESVSAACAVLREHGLRVSAARRLVVEALFAADGPVSAELIARGLEGRLPTSDLTSVYRNLETFEAIGLVRHVHLGHGPGLYALVGQGEREYLICEACDRIRALDPAELDDVRETIRSRYGFEVRFSHFPLVGLCAACGRERTTHRGDHA